jgi:hypothetical protein
MAVAAAVKPSAVRRVILVWFMTDTFGWMNDGCSEQDLHPGLP